MSTDGDLFDEIVFVTFVTTIFFLNYSSSWTYSSSILVSFSVFEIFMLSLGAFLAFSEKQSTRKSEI